MPTLHALLIGINGYTQCRPLEGCINDTLAIGQFFDELCAAQPNLNWKPRYLLHPGSDLETNRLQYAGISFQTPTRQNIIAAFQHFDEAVDGDFCLLYYSGHGSTTLAPDMLKGYEPGDILQTIVCADSRVNGTPDLLDKELGYLIARALEGKQPDPETQKQGVHFLAIFDSCHSGTATRNGDPNTPVARMAISGPTPTKIEGFTTTGNCFYDAFEPGQIRVKPGGIRHARHVNLSAARDTESALEMYFSGAYGEKTRRGVFTWSLLETLRQNGTNLTYAELLHRVELMVRTRVDNQIPVLGKTLPGDDGLLFFRNQLRPKKPETFYAAFDERTENWTLNAGALNGIPDPATGIQACVRLDNRMIRITHVLPGQATLDATAFTDADKNLKTLAVTLDGAWLRHIVVGWNGLNNEQQQAIRNAFEHNPPTYARLDPDSETPQYLIKTVPDTNSNFAPCFILTRPGSNVPLFMRTPQAHQFVTDLAQVCRYEHVLQLQNPASAIPPDAVTVSVSTLEGVYYDAESFKTISKDNDAFSPVPNQSPTLAPYPAAIHVKGKYVHGQLIHPAIKIRITASSGSKYWVGALYCDEKMGISSAFLPVTKIGFGENADYLESDFMQGAYKALPLTIDPKWFDLGASAIQDYLVVFVATQKFDLSQYEQAGIILDTTRSIGFSNNKAFYKEDWRTIKIPVHVTLPLRQQTLAAARELDFNGFVMGVPEQMSGTCAPVTRARMREVPPGADWHKVLPPDTLWDGVEGFNEVFSRGIANLPDTHICMLEFQAEYLYIGAENYFILYPADPPGAAEAIVPYGYDSIANTWEPMGYTLESGAVILTKLPEYTPYCFATTPTEGSNQSIKVFFQKAVWDGAIATVEGNMRVRQVAFPDLKTNQ